MFGEELELSPAPLLGEHSRGILAELGYPPAKIDELAAAGVIRTSDTE